jgi:predicted dehydrogenase
MSSELVQARFPLQRVALIGGGRWSRVLLPLIQSLLVESAEILWVTKYGYEHASRWLMEKGIGNVSVQSEIDLNVACLDGAIVATSPATHGGFVTQLLTHGIPTFCEKPLTLDFEQAVRLQQMATVAGCPLGVNLEMYFASFIEDFKEAIFGRNIREIAITWLDPWSETRYGETKHGDIYTSLVDDMWPHCWSVLRRLSPHSRVDGVHEVGYDPNSGFTEIVVHIHSIVATIELSRRSDRRIRRLDVNRGEAVLDFSAEPGSTEIDGTRSINAWRGMRPLSRSLSSFFEVVLRPELNTTWALSGCVDAVRTAQAIGDKLKSLQQAKLCNLKDTGVDLANTAHRNLIVDLRLPEYATEDRRWSAITLEEQIEFVRYVCVTEGIPFR